MRALGLKGEALLELGAEGVLEGVSKILQFFSAGFRANYKVSRR